MCFGLWVEWQFYLLVTMKGLPLFTHIGRKDQDHMLEREERKNIELSERARRERMEQIDFFQGDSSADDHAPYVVLHKHLATAEGNDRSKQGIIANTSNW